MTVYLNKRNKDEQPIIIQHVYTVTRVHRNGETEIWVEYQGNLPREHKWIIYAAKEWRIMVTAGEEDI